MGVRVGRARRAESKGPFRGAHRGFRRGVTALLAAALATGGIAVAWAGTAGAAGSVSVTVSGPSTVAAGTDLHWQGTVTNTGATPINGFTSIGSTSRGHILSTSAGSYCQITNVGDNVTGYSILACDASWLTLFPGQWVSVDVVVDTTGLEGQSITYTGHEISADLVGGRSADVNATVNVLSPVPTVAITSPLDGRLLDNNADTLVTADATAVTGQSITSVDFVVDGEVSIGTDYDPPFAATLPVQSLSQGTHTLTATAHDTAGHSGSDTITVVQGVPPTVAITSPADGTTLDTGTATTFQATATPSTDATVTSVGFYVDESLVASLAAPVPDSNEYRTSIPPNSLTTGGHNLWVQVNDSNGESATASLSVTQPALVGPTVTIKQPNGFDPSFLDSPRTFQPTIVLQRGDVIQSVSWDVDGSPLFGSPSKPYAVTVDPVALGPGTHSLNVTVRSDQGFGSDTLVVTVPPATLVVDDATPPDGAIAPLSPRFVPGPNSTDDAAWNVPVTNTGTGTARGVTLDLAVTDGVNDRPFDLGAMLPGCSTTTVFGTLTGVRCPVADVAPGATQFVPVRVPTNGLADGTALSGFAQVGSSNAQVPGQSTLSTTTALVPAPVLDDTGTQIAVAAVVQTVTPVSAATASVTNTVDPVSSINQLKVKVTIPRKVAANTLTPAAAGPTTSSRTLTTAALSTTPIKLASPPGTQVFLSAGQSDDPIACPDGCKGLPAIIGGTFSFYKDRVRPIKVLLSTFLPLAEAPNPAKGIPGTVGDLYFTGDAGTYQLTGATGRANCFKDPVTKQYNTPCHLGTAKFKVVKDPVTGRTLGVTATDVVLFVGGDPTLRRK